MKLSHVRSVAALFRLWSAETSAETGYAPESPRLLLVMLTPVAEAAGTITSAVKTTHARIESFIGLVDPI